LSGSVRDGAARSLSEIRAKLQEEAFNLVILGQFKRGKSTFINVLLGENILPTAIVPLTSVVTILRYCPELKIDVRYLDDHRESVNLADLTAYITERGNPQNKKGVKEVIVFYPSEYLKGGVRIIDTPGVGSVYRHNTDVAYNYLPYVDAGILHNSPKVVYTFSLRIVPCYPVIPAIFKRESSPAPGSLRVAGFPLDHRAVSSSPPLGARASSLQVAK